MLHLASTALLIASGACSPATPVQDLSGLTGNIKIDGSSTVYPITEAVAEEFRSIAPRVRLSVGYSGTGGGFKKFSTGETDISDASRPIKPSELEMAKKNGIDVIELPVAYDGLSVVVNKNNYWVDQLSVDEIRKIFVDDNPAKTWQDVRPDWPDREIRMFIPGTDSGTFDYFKEVVAGDKSIRSDVTASEDDNVLVKGVAGDEAAIGFFGCAYYFENKDKLNVVPIVNPTLGKAISPTPVTIEDGSYAPFSRPLFIYVSTKSADREEVKAFVDFYLENAAELASAVGYVRLPKAVYDRAMKNYKSKKTGTQFHDANGEPVHGPVTKVYK
jgi:phosphate transport system substrate-binding protein